RFAHGMDWLNRQGADAFLEIGPKPVLLGLARECSEAHALQCYASLRPGTSDMNEMLSSLARLYSQGAEVNWRNFESHREHRFISLPTYPFQGQRHWLQTSFDP